MKVSGNTQITAVSAACFTLAVLLLVSRITKYTSDLDPYWFQYVLVLPIAIGMSALALWCGIGAGRRLLQFFIGILLVMGVGWLIAGAVRVPPIIGLAIMPEVFVLVIFAVCFWALTFSKPLENEMRRRKEKRRLT